jgi:hypothetical protein
MGKNLYIFEQCGMLSIVEYGTTIYVVDCVKSYVLARKGSLHIIKKAGHSSYNVLYLFYDLVLLSHDMH